MPGNHSLVRWLSSHGGIRFIPVVTFVAILGSTGAAQGEPRSIESIRRMLASDDPGQIALGATYARKGHHRDLGIELEAALYRALVARSKVKDDSRPLERPQKYPPGIYSATEALFDALIRLRVEVREPLRLATLAGPTPAALHLLACVGNETARRQALFNVLRRRPSYFEWDYIVTRIARKPDRELWDYLWHTLEVTVEVVVVEKGGSPGREFVGETDRVSCQCFWGVASGFPATSHYYFRERDQITRISCRGGKYVRFGCHACLPHCQERRLSLLQEAMGDVGSPALPVVFRVVIEDPVEPEMFRDRIIRKIKCAKSAIESAASVLKTKGVVAESTSGPTILVVVRDLRKDPERTELPELLDLPSGTVRVKSRIWMVGWGLVSLREAGLAGPGRKQ